MSTTASNHPNNTLVDAIVQHLCGVVSTARRSNAESFARHFLKRVPDDELRSRGDAGWSALILSMLDFLQVRVNDHANVRVFNPTRDEHGFDSSHTIVQIVFDDMPFLVDSVSMAITGCENLVVSVIHPVFGIERDVGGHVLGISTDPEKIRGKLESIMHIEVERRSEPEEMNALQAGVTRALLDVRACVRDWPAMRDKAVAISNELSDRKIPAGDAMRGEMKEFLLWLADNHFTFLGFREYRVDQQDGEEVLKPVHDSGLGVLRQHETKVRSLKELDQETAKRDGIILTKTNARSTVHRPGYMDYVGVIQFDENGKAIGEQRFIGMYASGAYNRRPWDVPIVRLKYEAVMDASGYKRESHSGRALRHILEAMPRDELFQSTARELESVASQILALQHRQRTRLFVRRDRYGRFYSCLVFLPRDRFSPLIGERIEALAKTAFNGERVDSNILIGDSALARIHLVVRPQLGTQPQMEIAELEQRISNLVRNWTDELRDILVQRLGEEKGLKLANRFGKGLPAGYIETVTPWIAAQDVEHAAQLKSAEDIRITLYRNRKHETGSLRFKLFRLFNPVALSDILPMLENMGLRIISEHPYQIEVHGGNIFVQDFEVESALGEEIDVDAVDAVFNSAFERVQRGEAENDGFNRLILLAGLEWRQVTVLRGYAKYLLQTGVPFSQTSIEQTLVAYPTIAKGLIEFFEAKFDPVRELHNGLARKDQIENAFTALKPLLEMVSSLDQDRILRALIGVIGATLRTNFYQLRDGKTKDYVSFKFDTARVPDLPKPRPYREIFVYSPRVEGVHLRFGPVARGGLRWSDRREDFRTEVLGLVKAQMVKNTVIVPVGAKGGFYVKRPPIGGDRDAQLAEGVACYRTFIHALLDITDNLVEGKVVHPQNVVRHDADDPYLVVAADKGTATFSDIANSVSIEHGFWMGDAFASGGSQGYDHKKMGITAKGGWESVKRHFRAMGRDSQSQDFTCVGVGDMSGDVFGNGMLLSKHIRLFAAFDHRHIFLDPNPDAAKSFIERERMFNLPRSSWDDYDKAQISNGGGIFPRSAKTIAISAEVRAMLELDANTEQMTPNELMTAILKAPVDLLWNGGIGTYVKAQTETHADCGDRANNAIRINGNELRCKLIGEGGNLGMTQKGRVEAAQNGVLLNTDFIDNSAGVDTSDHEVNIKILLNDVVGRNVLNEEQRNQLLAQMTDEVGYLVLRDNYLQNQAISVMERVAFQRLGAKQHFIRVLEANGQLDRVIEFLPSDAEIAERKARGQGFTRPELSVLLSYSKIVLFTQLLESDVPEDPYLSKELIRYFPKPLQEKYPDAMERHRLRREIIATVITNSTVNRMGATFVLRMQEDTGATSAQIAKAYTIAREVLQARDIWNAIEALDGKVNGNAQIDAMLVVWNLLRHLTRWLLNLPGDRLDIAFAVSRYAPGLTELRQNLSKVLAPSDIQAVHAEQARWVKHQFPQELSQQLASLTVLASSFDIVDISIEHKISIERAASVFFAMGESLHLKWLLNKVEVLPVDGRWHAHARGSARDELFSQQRALVDQVLSTAGKASAEQAVNNWLGRDDSSLRFTLSMLNDMRQHVEMDYPTLSVAVRRLAQLVQAGTRN